MNKLYFGDNLEIMREMDTGAVDLICTDPPFNSGRNYNAFFKESQAQNKSFTDIWTWDTEAIKARTEIETPTYEKCDLDTYKALDTCLKGYDMGLQNAVSGNKGSMRAYLAFKNSEGICEKVVSKTDEIALYNGNNTTPLTLGEFQ